MKIDQTMLATIVVAGVLLFVLTTLFLEPQLEKMQEDDV